MTKPDIEKAPIFMVRGPRGLSPATPFDAERLDKIAWGATVEVTIKQRRSNPQNRLYWSVVSKAAENLDGFPTAEHLHEALKEHLGFVEPYTTIGGKLAWRPQSAAFAAMDGAEFKAFMDRAFAVLAAMLGCDPVSLIEEAKGDVA